MIKFIALLAVALSLLSATAAEARHHHRAHPPKPRPAMAWTVPHISMVEMTWADKVICGRWLAWNYVSQEFAEFERR